MIIGEKISMLRRKSGMSQEELADKLDVSRQSVSKWESSASIPDMNRVLELSRIFSVSCDYLLKDEIELEPSVSEEQVTNGLTLEQAMDFVGGKIYYGKRTALAVLLCMLGPTILVFLAGLSQPPVNLMSETAAGVSGIIILLGLIAVAVLMFIKDDNYMRRYKYITRGSFELNYGVAGVIKERKIHSENRISTMEGIAVVMCIMSPVPLIVAGGMSASDFICIMLTVLLLLLVSAAVVIFIISGGESSAYNILLRDEEYDPVEIRKNRRSTKFNKFYWAMLVALYLIVSFLTNRWDLSWIIFAAGAIIGAGISHLLKDD